MRRILISLLFLLFASGILNAWLPVVEKGKPVGRIVLSTNDKVDIKAAYLLQDFIQRISGTKVPVQKDTNVRKYDIIIGNGGLDKEIATKDIKEDGFRILSSTSNMRIVSGGGYGSVYAVQYRLRQGSFIDGKCIRQGICKSNGRLEPYF